MGSSLWLYSAPYQDDIEQALQTLRQQVFEDQNKEWILFVLRECSSKEVVRALEEVDTTGPSYHILEDLTQVLKSKQITAELPEHPQTIEAYFEDEDIQLMGHHSIVDITHIDPDGCDGYLTARRFYDPATTWLAAIAAYRDPAARHFYDPTATPLPHEGLIGAFGTDKPTKKMVEAEFDERQLQNLGRYLYRWHAVYIVVYQGDTPHEIVFIGQTGD
jgi:hypothetical protein